jgi:hypothetical protein
MHRNIRIFLGSLAFAGVSVLSAAEQAPYVQAGDDAEAFTGGQSSAHTGVGDKACNANCMRSIECKGSDLSCLRSACLCTTSIQKQKPCSPREPCAQKEGSQQACLNGVCVYRCATDKDCAQGGGGVCKAGSCRARSPDDVSSCKQGCEACKKLLVACKDKVAKCIASCN